MTCTITYLDNTTATCDEAAWRAVLASAAWDGKGVYRAQLFDGDVIQAEWRDGSMWIYNDTIDGINPLLVSVE